MKSKQFFAQIIPIGRPGVGKSQLQNSLSGKENFKSGDYVGSGLTQTIEKTKEIQYLLGNKNNLAFQPYDFPGIGDLELSYQQIIKDMYDTTLLDKEPLYACLIVLKANDYNLVAEDAFSIKLFQILFENIVNERIFLVFTQCDSFGQPDEKKINFIVDQINNLFESTGNKILLSNVIFFRKDQQSSLNPLVDKLVQLQNKKNQMILKQDSNKAYISIIRNMAQWKNGQGCSNHSLQQKLKLISEIFLQEQSQEEIQLLLNMDDNNQKLFNDLQVQKESFQTKIEEDEKIPQPNQQQQNINNAPEFQRNQQQQQTFQTKIEEEEKNPQSSQQQLNINYAPEFQRNQQQQQTFQSQKMELEEDQNNKGKLQNQDQFQQNQFQSKSQQNTSVEHQFHKMTKEQLKAQMQQNTQKEMQEFQQEQEKITRIKQEQLEQKLNQIDREINQKMMIQQQQSQQAQQEFEQRQLLQQIQFQKEQQEILKKNQEEQKKQEKLLKQIRDKQIQEEKEKAKWTCNIF